MDAKPLLKICLNLCNYSAWENKSLYEVACLEPFYSKVKKIALRLARRHGECGQKVGSGMRKKAQLTYPQLLSSTSPTQA